MLTWKLTWLPSRMIGKIMGLLSCVIHGQVNTCTFVGLYFVVLSILK